MIVKTMLLWLFIAICVIAVASFIYYLVDRYKNK